MIEVDRTEALVEGTIEEVFHTPYLDNRQVTTRVGGEATNDEDRGFLEFDYMIDIPIYDRLPYLLDNKATEVADLETQPKEGADQKDGAPNV